MMLRFLRSISLLALLALIFTACANKESADSTLYEDAPLDASGYSGRGDRGRSVAESSPPSAPVGRITAAGGTGESAPMMIASVTTSSASDGSLALRGGRTSETAVRVDGVTTTDFVGTSARVAPASTTTVAVAAEGMGEYRPVRDETTGGEIMLADVAEGSVDKSEVLTETIIADRKAGAEEVGDIVVVDDLYKADDEAEKVEEEIKERKPEPLPSAGQLTAGEWNDLDDWTFWTSLSASKDWNHMNDHWGLGKGERLSIRVDNGHDPIPDAVAQLFDKKGRLLWTARTDNFGRAELFTGLQKREGEAPYEVVVRSGEKESRLGGIDPSREQSPSESPLVVRLSGAAPQLKMVDLMFMVDATGSMGDELGYIQAELQNVIDRVQQEMGEEFVIRLSTNVYRDKGDEYVVRSQEFSEKIEEAAEFLQRQSAGGGGDTPEAVEEALEDGIRNHAWSESAQSRFLFMVLDAPPHYSEDRLEKIRELTVEASMKGIRIIGVSGSGVDKETEFLMRNLGIHTGGTYVFLTDHSGIGESHIEPTIGSYQIEYLNDLIVRLIVQYTKRPESVDAIAPRRPSLE